MTVGTKVAAIVMGGLHFVANLATRPAPQLGCPGGLRMRVLLLAPLVLCVATRAAWATGQVPERIVVNGQLHELYSTPLAPLLERREDLEGSFPSWSTGCWRGYVGSWQVIGDRLELVAMTHGDDPPWPGFRSDDSSDVTGREHDALPLLFGDRRPPFLATWYTGELRVPITARWSYVHMGFATTWERELVLDVVRGRIQGRRVLDRRELMKGRSKEDQVWVGLAATANAAARGAAPLDDRGPWLDARMLDTGEVDHRIPAGEMFVTRGILLREEPDKEPFLWIPETDVSREVRLPLHAKALPAGTRTWPHVELEATWKTESGRSVLEVSWMRLLVPGETIHRTDLDWTALPPKGPDVDEYRSRSPYTRDETPIASREDVLKLHVALPWAYCHGPLEGPRASSVYGVEVAPTPALAGETVVVEGHLQTWVITARLLRLELPELEPFRARGPGIYYRLVDEYTGALATPRTVGKPR